MFDCLLLLVWVECFAVCCFYLVGGCLFRCCCCLLFVFILEFVYLSIVLLLVGTLVLCWLGYWRLRCWVCLDLVVLA